MAYCDPTVIQAYCPKCKETDKIVYLENCVEDDLIICRYHCNVCQMNFEIQQKYIDGRGYMILFPDGRFILPPFAPETEKITLRTISQYIAGIAGASFLILTFASSPLNIILKIFSGLLAILLIVFAFKMDN